MKKISGIFFLFLIAFGTVLTDLHAGPSTFQQDPQSTPPVVSPVGFGGVPLEDPSTEKEQVQKEEKQGLKERLLANKLIGGIFISVLVGGIAVLCRYKGIPTSK